MLVEILNKLRTEILTGTSGESFSSIRSLVFEAALFKFCSDNHISAIPSIEFSRLSGSDRTVLERFPKFHAALWSLNLSEVDDLAYIFDHLIDPRTAKHDGVFYTPGVVVKKIVSDTVGVLLADLSHEQYLSIRVLDPACGSGLFLLEAFRLIRDRAISHFGNSLELRVRILQSCIYGVDKNLASCEATKTLLLLELINDKQLEFFDANRKIDLTHNIAAGNSLLAPENFGSSTAEQALAHELSAFSWSKHFPEIMQNGGFDCVIGNPPYGLSRDAQIGKLENDRLKNVYQQFRSGKVNKYQLFMIKGYQLLNERGYLSYIVPNSWLGIRDGLALRRYFLKAAAIQNIVIYNCPVFERASMEAVTFKIGRAQRTNRIKICHLSKVEEIPETWISVPSSRCLKNIDSKIPIYWSDEVGQLLEKLSSGNSRLGDPNSLFEPLISLQAYATGKGNPKQSEQDVKNHIYDRTFKEDETCIPYLNGQDIQRYGYSWSGQYLKYGPWLAEFQDLKRYSGPRVVIREILAPLPYLLSACLLEEQFLYNKSVLHILPKNEYSKELCWALLGIINSKVISFYLRFHGRKSQRSLFPKVVNNDLKELPLPAHFITTYSELASLCKNISSAHNSREPTEELQTRIDDTVYRLFNLTNSEVNLISRSLVTQDVDSR